MTEDPQQLYAILGTVAGLAAFATLVLLAINLGRLATALHERNAEASRANVVASVEPPRRDGGRPELVVVNTGPAAAFDVRVTFDPPLFDYLSVEQVRAPFKSIGVLRPGQEVVTPLPEDSVVEERAYGLALSWKSAPGGARESLRYEAVMRDRVAAPADQPEALAQIADYLRRMRKDYRSVAQRLGERAPEPARDRGEARVRERDRERPRARRPEARAAEGDGGAPLEPERRRARKANGDGRASERGNATRPTGDVVA